MALFVDDYEAATAHLTLEEDGAYNRLLRLCWRTPGCSIPDCADWIARKLRVDAETYARVIDPLIDEFFTREKGRVFQKRQVKEFEHAVATTKRRKAAGSKGGSARALKEKEKTLSNAKANVKRISSTHTHTHTHTQNTPKSPQGDGQITQDFEEFWQHVPRKIGKGQARKAYLTARKSASADEILSGVKRHAREVKGTEARFIPHPSTWLNGERWTDESTGGSVPQSGNRDAGPSALGAARAILRNRGK